MGHTFERKWPRFNFYLYFVTIFNVKIHGGIKKRGGGKQTDFNRQGLCYVVAGFCAQHVTTKEKSGLWPVG